MVPAPFCAIGSINDGQYPPRDTEPEPERVRQAQKNNVELSQAQSPDSALDLTCFRILAIRSKPNIDYCEKKYVEYGSSSDLTVKRSIETQFIQFIVYVVLQTGYFRELVR